MDVPNLDAMGETDLAEFAKSAARVKGVAKVAIGTPSARRAANVRNWPALTSGHTSRTGMRPTVLATRPR